MHSHPPTLLELQRAIGKGLLHGVDAGLGAFVAADGLTPQARLGIYRNTAIGTLVTALRLAYPAIRALIGPEFFEGAARLFMEDSPPGSAWLDTYGANFPEFLAGLPQAASLAYLPDTARLEWAVNAVLHAPDAKPLDLARLAQLEEAQRGDVCFVPHPAVRLVQSDFPVDAIWRAVLSRDDGAIGAIDLSAGPVWLLVHRTPSGIEVDHLGAWQWRFAAACSPGVHYTLRWRKPLRPKRTPGLPRCWYPAALPPSGGAASQSTNPSGPFLMSNLIHSAHSSMTLAERAGRVLAWLDRIPHTVLAIPLRLAVATVFWNSAMAKLANWESALELFREDYKVPLIPPDLAAYVAVSIELTAPVLLVLGLATRPVALVLLGMTTVIELFVYPQAWPTHIQWAAMLLVLLARGPGKFSIDWLIRRRMLGTD